MANEREKKKQLCWGHLVTGRECGGQLLLEVHFPLPFLTCDLSLLAHVDLTILPYQMTSGGISRKPLFFIYI